MSLTQLLVSIAGLGTEWVLWLLLGLSILSCQIILDRGCYFWRRRVDADWLAKQVLQLLRIGEVDKARAIVGRKAAPECVVLAAGLNEFERGPQVVAEAMKCAQTRERLRMEGETNLLPMIAAYAPVIGLMGSVLGGVNTVHNMASPYSEWNLADATTAGLSEALIASGAGLFVAVLAGVGNHLLQRRVQTTIGRTVALTHLVLAEAQIHEAGAAAQSQEPSAGTALESTEKPTDSGQLKLSRAA